MTEPNAAQLAHQALDCEYGSQQQTDAFNDLMHILEANQTPEEHEEFSAWCVQNPKPTTVEIVWEALEILVIA